jgi:8-oxo-dGTP pyrophosphatase MutT (NUDIX family)
MALPYATDGLADRFPVSVKGVLIHEGATVLLRNARDEWELPGGKLELGEAPEDTVIREVNEELSLFASLGPLLDAWVYEIRPDVTVFIVTYGLLVDSFAGMHCSFEHKEARAFALQDVADLAMPDGYKRSITRYAAMIDSDH